MVFPDLTQTSLSGLISLLLGLAALDTAVSVVIAMISGNFAVEHLLDYLRTHVLARVFPIAALLIIGHGLSPVGVPPIEAASAAGIASLVAYGIETLASLQSSFKDRAVAPPDPTTDGPVQ